MIPTPTLPPLIAPSRAISVSSRRRLGSAACAFIGTACTNAATNETRSGLSERARADGRIELLQWAGEGHEHRMLNSDMLDEDRKSTRLNSSHSQISYAVFCL